MSLSGPRIKLEEKELIFEFGINQTQFNKTGSYYLCFSIKTSQQANILQPVSVENLLYEILFHHLFPKKTKFQRNVSFFMVGIGGQQKFPVDVILSLLSLNSMKPPRNGPSNKSFFPPK